MKPRDIFQYALGAIIVVAFFLMIYLLLFNGVPEVNKDLLNITAGALISAFTGIVGYYYGSSKGSSDKNEMLKNNGNK
jgi:hypothetical protein